MSIYSYDEIDERQAQRATQDILQWAFPLVRQTQDRSIEQKKGMFAACVMLYTGWLAREMKPFSAHADCKSKCSYCCYQMIQVSPFEAFKIATVLKEEALPRVSLAAERLAPYNKGDIEQRFRDGIPCVFLRNRECSIYAVRPTTCATFLSLDVRKCKAGWEGRFLPEIPSADYIKASQNIGISGQMALDFAFWKHGLQTSHWELSYAVSTAAKPGALDAWLSGQPVFDPARRFVYKERGREGFYESLMSLMDGGIEFREAED